MDIRLGATWAAVLAGLLFVCAGASRAEAVFGDHPVSDDVRFAAGRVLEESDHEGRPFAIVDKREARIYVFGPAGSLVGASAVLVGLTPGDDASRMFVWRPSSLTPAERTTPAGRFASEPGRNDKGEDIVWFDYDAALAIHRLRPGAELERRAERMVSPIAAEHRISYGCVVVPVSFYEAVVRPNLGVRRGVVYVLPETRPVHALFDSGGMTTAGLAARSRP